MFVLENTLVANSLFITTVHELGAEIRAERKARGFSQLQLAEKLGIQRQTLAALEAGGGRTNVFTLMAVLVALGKGIRIADRLPSLLDDADLDLSARRRGDA